MRIIEHKAKVAMFFFSDIVLERLGVYLVLVSNIVERFGGMFATDGSEVSSLEEGVVVIHIYCHGG